MVLSSASNRVDTPEFGLQKVIGKLTQGRNKADQLHDMLQEIIRGSAWPAEAQVMVGEILDTFAQSLEMLTAGAADSVDEVSQVPAGTKALCRRKMEDSGDSCKTPAPKDRRGCYKRRKTEETLIKETPDFFEDGNAWRKYGQKKILNSKHPRNYFRCTHKFDQGCRATKQVQKIQDDPPLMRTTYLGHHTCTNLDIKSTHHQIMMDAAAPDSSIIWSFAQSGEHEDYKPDTRMLISPVVLNAPNKLQENKEEPDHQQQIQSSNSPFYDNGDCFLQDDELTTFDTSDHDVISSGGLSCSASNYNSMDLDLDEIFKFDSKGLY